MPTVTELLLIVSATEAEAAHVPGELPIVITGIGKTAAAVHTTRALAAYTDPSAVTVINLGTAGALRPGVVGLHTPGVVLNHDVNGDEVRALGYDPQERIEIGPDETVLATGDVFVTDPAVRDRLAARASLVDMEGYAVAWAARAMGADVHLVKHVSDAADETARDWNAVVDASARALASWLEEWRASRAASAR